MAKNTKNSSNKSVEKWVDNIVKECRQHFRCFGGGYYSPHNPISVALVEKPPVFAAGVDVKEVVTFVMNQTLKGIKKHIN